MNITPIQNQNYKQNRQSFNCGTNSRLNEAMKAFSEMQRKAQREKNLREEVRQETANRLKKLTLSRIRKDKNDVTRQGSYRVLD